MAITYPLTPPTTPGPTNVIIQPSAVVQKTESIFTFQQQVQAAAGQQWELNLTLPPMTRVQAAPWIGFLSALNGQEGTFIYGPLGNEKTRQGLNKYTSDFSADVDGWTMLQGTLVANEDSVGGGKRLHALLSRHQQRQPLRPPGYGIARHTQLYHHGPCLYSIIRGS